MELVGTVGSRSAARSMLGSGIANSGDNSGQKFDRTAALRLTHAPAISEAFALQRLDRAHIAMRVKGALALSAVSRPQK